MRIGYACKAVGVPYTDIKSCTQAKATPDRLHILIEHNLEALQRLIDYNARHKIDLFRISSDIIPFASSIARELPWSKLFCDKFADLAKQIKLTGMRISMHPGQYTIINSPNAQVVENAVADLSYHALFLDSLLLPYSHKIVVHVGGIYQDKKAALERFRNNFALLPENVKNRLVIENDDRLFSIEDVLTLSETLKIPAVFDNLHHQVNPGKSEQIASVWIQRCKQTWAEKDGPQKIHYAQQEPGKRIGAHSNTIILSDFLDFCDRNQITDQDIMLEVKDKNLSAKKCIIGSSYPKNQRKLEKEWSDYKYPILERSPQIYLAIRKQFREKTAEALTVYPLVESGMSLSIEQRYAVNAIEHVWGYMKDIASQQEKQQISAYLERYISGRIGLMPIKRFLWKLANTYHQSFLIDNPLYFFC